MTMHDFVQECAEDTYERWTDGRFSIVRYGMWEGREGCFFMAYDLNNMSRRINQKPVSSFDEAIVICERMDQ